MSMLNRWVDQKRVAQSGKELAPRASRFASESKSIKECELARSQLIRQISTLLNQIQNAAMGEQRVRDMNDEINRLIRQKFSWEMQMRKLGGPDYTAQKLSTVDIDGMEIPGQGGYKYFGAAKDLPGVRELIEEAPVKQTKKTRKDFLHLIGPGYYGWNDEKSDSLILEERSATEEAVRMRNEMCKTARVEHLLSSLEESGASRDQLDLFRKDCINDPTVDGIEARALDLRRQIVIARYMQHQV